MQNKTSVPREKQIFRAAKSTYIIFLIVPVTLIVSNIIAGILHGCEGVIQMQYVLATVFVFLVSWISAFRINLCKNKVSYRTLFGGTRSLLRSEIEEATFETRFRTDSKPMYALTPVPKKESGKAPIIINLKVFRLDDVKSLREWLKGKSTGEFTESLFKKPRRKSQRNRKI